jgi:propanol-preferring alcohol dehydrogenase
MATAAPKVVPVGSKGHPRLAGQLRLPPPETFDFPLPFTLGHENTGWVEALGAGAGLKPGDPVAVCGPWAAAAAAPAAGPKKTSARTRPYHAIKRNLRKLVPGSSVAVIGVGGLGHMAVQILRAVSAAQVIAVDIDERRLELARQVGDSGTVRFGADAAAQIRDLPAGQGLPSCSTRSAQTRPWRTRQR